MKNAIVALAVVLSFFVGRLSIIAGFGLKKGWVEIVVFFVLWLLVSSFLESALEGEQVKGERRT